MLSYWNNWIEPTTTNRNNNKINFYQISVPATCMSLRKTQNHCATRNVSRPFSNIRIEILFCPCIAIQWPRHVDPDVFEKLYSGWIWSQTEMTHISSSGLEASHFRGKSGTQVCWLLFIIDVSFHDELLSEVILQLSNSSLKSKKKYFQKWTKHCSM